MLKDKTEFQQAKAEVMKRHNISKATVYREMNKEVPGAYRQPKYSNKARDITPHEKELVKTLLFKKIPLEQMCSEMEKLRNERYSWDRIDQIRKAIEPEVKKEMAALNRKKSPQTESTVSDRTVNEKPESAWGKDIKLVLEEALNIDKIDKDSVVSINIKGTIYKIGHDAIKEILMILANSAAEEGRDVMESLDQQIKHLLTQQVRYIKNGAECNVRDLYDILKMHKVMGGRITDNSIDFELLFAVVKDFAPDAIREDVETVTWKLSIDHPDCSIYIRPDEVKMHKLLVKEMMDNM